jgi:YHS domain-containing protein
MIRTLLLFILVVLTYYSLKTVIRSAFTAYHRKEERERLMGRDMVRDPQCGTYVPKDRAVTRRIGGRVEHFCSESCARSFTEQGRA